MSPTKIAPGQCVMAHNDRFAKVIATWEKVGQHQRDWFLVTHPRFGWDLIPDYVVEPGDDSLYEETEFKVEYTQLPLALRGRVVIDSTATSLEYGTGLGVITKTDPAGTVTHFSLGLAGSGYPWWSVPLTDDFRLLDKSDVNWDLFPDSLKDPGDEFLAHWDQVVAESPKFPQFG